MRCWPGWRAWPLPWLSGVTSPGMLKRGESPARAGDSLRIRLCPGWKPENAMLPRLAQQGEHALG
ncbi:hypothetical protein, partial [Mobiluncus mulieris]|uniref:hypothetical protein n=1 Tax=Mobiluncus mulieris TaxID=2052 RepID=UPI001B8D7F99